MTDTTPPDRSQKELRAVMGALAAVQRLIDQKDAEGLADPELVEATATRAECLAKLEMTLPEWEAYWREALGE